MEKNSRPARCRAWERLFLKVLSGYYVKYVVEIVEDL